MTASVVRRRYVDGPFGQVHLRAGGASGKAPPFYAIHQSPASGRIYEPLLVELARDREVAAGDTPGYGESDAPAEPPTIADYARAHGAALDALGWSTVDVMGYYTGSRVAVELALQRPLQVRRLVLLGAAIYRDDELARERATYAERVPDWKMSHLKAWWDHLKRHRNPDYPLDSFLRDFAEIQRGGRVSPWGHAAAHAYHLEEKLPLLRQPVVVICTDDAIGAISRRAATYLGTNGRLVDLAVPGQGLIELHTARVAAILRQAFDG
jgi:pimeloyl-ACP methyl ester carboxylesterase